ncbi:MAG: branched-chain amino acid ABC transporter ATP-binding protein/permease [Xanthobacteraceae bacterium]
MSAYRAVVVLLAALAMATPYLAFIPGWTPSLATTVAFKAVALVGLNLIFGLAGMLAFGQAAFMVLPGYAAGILAHMGVPFLAAAALGFAVTVVIARVVAAVFVKLPGIFLAVGTLGFGFAVEGLARAFPSWTGGASGLVFASGRQIGPAAWYAIAVAALIAALLSYRLYVRDAVWRRLRTIRHDELAAEVLGIDVGREKARIFTIGSTYAAAGGLLLALYVGVIIPEDAGVSRSLEQIGTVLLGGAGSLLGPLVGTAIVDWLFVAAGYGARYELLIYGIAFLGVVIYAPHGIVGWLAGPSAKLAARLQRAPRPLAAPTGTPRAGAGYAPPLIPVSDVDRREGVCLEVDGVSHRFGGVVALDQVSFQAAFGDILMLVGPNGAGKTTLFNMISGILQPAQGSMRLCGRDLASMPIHGRAPFIGRSFQVARLVPELSAQANVMTRLDQVAPKLDEAERQVAALGQLQAFGLEALAERPVRELSLGQHKLIDLARAAVGDPPLVLLDEPAVGLSAEELAHLADVLRTLVQRRCAVIIVEHNIEFVADLAQWAIVLDTGRKIASGRVQDVLTNPKVQEAYFGALT